METCARCYGNLSEGEHGLYLCPLEPRKSALVIADEIPGGVLIKHGLCDANGDPVRYYSKSAIAAEAKKRGLVQRVEHVPLRGSDKSPHTTRWY
jgi:hypothetical protein